MRKKNKRIDQYCYLFGLTSRATAGRKINQLMQLKPSEVFFSMMDSNDIDKIIDFIEGKSNHIRLEISRNPKLHQIKTSITPQSKPVKVATINGTEYYAYKWITNKKDDQILKEFEMQLQSQIDETLSYIEKYDYAENTFDKQTLYKDFEAYLEYILGNENAANEREIAYRTKQQDDIPNGRQIGSYAKYLYFKKRFEALAENVFDNEINSINIENTLDQILNELYTIMREKYNIDFDEEFESDIDCYLDHEVESETVDNHLFKYIVTNKLIALLERHRIFQL